MRPTWMVREAGRIVSVAVTMAVAVNPEAEPFWSGFLRSLTRRGLRGVKRMRTKT